MKSVLGERRRRYMRLYRLRGRARAERMGQLPNGDEGMGMASTFEENVTDMHENDVSGEIEDHDLSHSDISDALSSVDSLDMSDENNLERIESTDLPVILGDDVEIGNEGIFDVRMCDSLPDISLVEALAVVQQFITDTNLTQRGTSKLLNLLHRLIPESNLPRTTYKMKSMLDSLQTVKGTSKCFQICNNCCENKRIHSQSDESTVCEACASPNVARFWQMDIERQLRQYIETGGLLDHVVFPADQGVDDNDVHRLHYANSLLYKEFSDAIPLHSRSDLSYSICSDGFALCHTSALEVCPVYLSVTEVSNNMKYKYVVICGVWAGKRKVQTAAFLPIIVQDLNRLRYLGVQYKNPSGESAQIRLHPLLAIFDAPARADALCFKRFNAKYGCDKCYVLTTRQQGNTGRFYPVNITRAMLREAERLGCTQPELRNMADTLHLASIQPTETLSDTSANHSNVRDILGVKRVSPLASLAGFDFIRGCPPCYLHQACSGLVRWIIFQLFLIRREKPDPTAPSPDLHTKIGEIDRLLTTIKVPCSVQRRGARPLKDIKHYRGHELEMWLFVYAPMTLEALLPPDHFNHILLLSSALFWLTHEGTPMEELVHVKTSLQHFHSVLPRLYSHRALTYNAHQVCVHMLAQAYIAGPLHLQSANLFESFHGGLRASIHGSRLIDIEIVNMIERRIATAQISARTFRLSSGENRFQRKLVVVQKIGDVTLRRRSNEDDWSKATFSSGLEVEPFSPDMRNRRRISCFIAIVGKQPCTFQFARIRKLSTTDDGQPFALLDNISVIEPVMDPLFALAGVSAEADRRGCRYAHVKRLACDPFGDLGDSPLQMPLTKIVGCCAMSDTHIALLPHSQLPFS